MKYSWSLTKCCCFLAARGGSRRGLNRSRGPLLHETSYLDRKATATNQMHSNDLEAFWKKYCYRYHNLRKTFGKFFRSYSELLSKFGDISFQEYLSKGISHPVFYGDLVYKLRRVKDTPNFILSSRKESNAFDDDSMTQ